MSAQPIPHYGPSPRRSTGVLNAWVQQPTDSSPAANAQKATYTEVWKGPWDVGKDVLTQIYPGDSITKFHNWLGSSRVFRIAPATPPSYTDSEGVTKQMVWKVESINVIEHKAGDHCTIRAVFYGAQDESSQEHSELIEGSEEWSLDWQPYTVSPFEFCSNDPHAPIPLSPSNQLQEDWQASACRDSIEQYRLWAGKAVEVEGAGGQTRTAYAWSPNPKQTNTAYPARYAMTDCEAEVWKKVQLGRNCIWHYPVLTYSSRWRGGVVFDPDGDDIGSGIDQRLVDDNLPAGCPYEFAPLSIGGESRGWIWVRTGDSIRQANDPAFPNDPDKKIYTRVKTWIGVDDIDDNFYGYGTFNHANEQGVTRGRWYKQCL